MEKAHPPGRVAPGLKILDGGMTFPGAAFHFSKSFSAIGAKENGLKARGEVMSMFKVFKAGTLEERVSGLEKYLEDLSLHRDSRKGLDGARGEKGKPGRDSVVAGPQGKDADPAQVAEIAKTLLRRDFQTAIENLESEITAAKAILRWAVIEELKASGVVDSDGNAIPGPTGVSGPKGDSTIGPAGKDGESIVGPAGRDATIVVGDVAVGEKASVSVREENGVHVFDFVLQRGERGEKGADSTVEGPVGPKGDSIEGPQGNPGTDGMSRQAVIDLILDMKKRGTLK